MAWLSWWLDYIIKCNLLTTLCISLVILSETITLKCHSCSNHKLWTELSSRVFHSLSIPKLFENSWEKLLYCSYIKSMYRMGHAPFSSSVYTITGSFKTHSVDSLLQHTAKNHQAAIIASVMCWGKLLCDEGSLMDANHPWSSLLYSTIVVLHVPEAICLYVLFGHFCNANQLLCSLCNGNVVMLFMLIKGLNFVIYYLSN